MTVLTNLIKVKKVVAVIGVSVKIHLLTTITMVLTLGIVMGAQ
jgi:hypothetical protein